MDLSQQSNNNIEMETTTTTTTAIYKTTPVNNNTSGGGGGNNDNRGAGGDSKDSPAAVANDNHQESSTKMTATNPPQDEPQKVSTNAQANQSDTGNIKFKRCKHGRIIIKDLSKKKLAPQSDDKETNNLTNESKKTAPIPNVKDKSDDKDLANQSVTEKLIAPNLDTTPIVKTNERIINQAVDSPTGSDKFYGPKEKETSETKCSNKQHTVESGRRNHLSKRIKSRSKSPPIDNAQSSRRRVSRSPPCHRKSPSRYRDRSPRRRDRSITPRRRDHSRDRESWRSPRQSGRSSKKRNRRGSRRALKSPPPPNNDRQRDKSPSRIRSSRRRRSESLSDDSRSPINTNRRPRVDSRSPDNRRDNYTRTSATNRNRESIFGKSPARIIDYPPKESSSSVAASSNHKNTSQELQPASGERSISNPPKEDTQSNCPSKALAQPQVNTDNSPVSDPSLSPSVDESISSDIYDPEEPILPLSPGDSPPISPMVKTANNSNNNNINNNNNNNNNSTNNHDQQLSNSKKTAHPDSKNDKNSNEDEFPSSAVELNKKEKYLQKLNRQERVVEEIKIALKPYYQRKSITKEQYKDVLRRAVPKICHSKDGEINPIKIRIMVDAYAKKLKRKNRNK